MITSLKKHASAQKNVFLSLQVVTNAQKKRPGSENNLVIILLIYRKKNVFALWHLRLKVPNFFSLVFELKIHFFSLFTFWFCRHIKYKSMHLSQCLEFFQMRLLLEN